MPFRAAMLQLLNISPYSEEFLYAKTISFIRARHLLLFNCTIYQTELNSDFLVREPHSHNEMEAGALNS